jgi:protein-tyrosine phosphatase
MPAGIKMHTRCKSIILLVETERFTIPLLTCSSLFLRGCVLPLLSYFCLMKILMVCLGNICRSPLAEGILQDKAFKSGLAWSVESAGTNSYHTGEPPHLLSQKVATLNGIDISRQRARRFTGDDFDAYDKIYALAEDVMKEMKRIAGRKYNAAKVDLLMNELYPGKNMDVPDPWYGPEPGYHEVFKLIEQACNAIVLKHSIPINQYSSR